jgi:amino acid transporter
MLHICGVSKMFGEWYQKTNKTEDTNKVNLFVSNFICIFCFVCFLVPFTEHFRHNTYMELLVKPEILTSYIYIYISYTVAQLCVSTLLATKVTLITDGI